MFDFFKKKEDTKKQSVISEESIDVNEPKPLIEMPLASVSLYKAEGVPVIFDIFIEDLSIKSIEALADVACSMFTLENVSPLLDQIKNSLSSHPELLLLFNQKLTKYAEEYILETDEPCISPIDAFK